MLPGDPITRTVLRRTATGLPSTGKLIADFAVTALLNGTIIGFTPTLAEVGTIGTWRIYSFSYNLPGTPGNFEIYIEPASGTDQVANGIIGDLVQSVDLTTIYGVLALPITSVVNAGGPQGDIALRLVQRDFAPISFTVTDTAGNPMDLSGWNNWQFGVRLKAQTETTPYLQITGITATAGGLVTIQVPEGATFFSNLTAGVDQFQLYWSLNGDQAADTTKTRTIARGNLTIVRQETRTP